MKNWFYVYEIQHNQTKRRYVGCTTRTGRIQKHFAKLRSGKHPSKIMQKDFNDFGNDFSIKLLEVGICGRTEHPLKKDATMTAEHLAEYKWMHLLNTIDDMYGYNSQDRMAVAYINQLRASQ